MTFFPKKSHHGYFDPTFQKHFYDKKQKEDFMKKNKFVEGDSVSKAHIRKVRDYVAWIKDEKRKNPNFEKTREFKKQEYPN